MLYTIINKNSYMDSVELMVLSRKIGNFPGVEKATVMMGTSANLEIMRKGGFGSDRLKEAQPNDMVIVVDTEEEGAAAAVVKAVEEAVRGRKETGARTGDRKTVRSWDEVKKTGEEYQVCLISVPGEYAAEEAAAALEAGKNVMLFSDNVSVEEERALKESAHAKGLAVMGPDCGTSILSGVSLAFGNEVRRGSIGIAGASGTGIQEVAVAVHHLGGGISHAIGTGGRDLHREIGGIMMKDAIAALEADPATDVIVVVSKPPDPSVASELRQMLQGLCKPSVVLFLGEKERKSTGKVCYVSSTEQAAKQAVELAGISWSPDREEHVFCEKFSETPKVLGLYAGGTLAGETAHMMREALELPEEEKAEGYVLKTGACEILDLGDDLYTRGKPHPMMDPQARDEKMAEMVRAIRRPVLVLTDVILGYGAAGRPAEGLAKAIRELLAEKKQSREQAAFFVHVLGTRQDVQGLEEQVRMLKEAGACVFTGNTEMVRAALKTAGYQEPAPSVLPEEPAESAGRPEPAGEGFGRLLQGPPGVINIGIKGFAEDLERQRAKVIHFDWRPAAGGDRKLKAALHYLDHYKFCEGLYETIDDANEAVLQRIRESRPRLVDVLPAWEVSHVFRQGKVLLHAGPPMKWEDMSHPMQGSCVGAVLFEEWVQTEEEAWEMLKRGEVSFLPCHHAGFVGPMGGITSAHMPVFKVENQAGGNFACCTMNEGIGEVLRFGAYGPKVIERLRFMRDTLGPVLGKAVRTVEGGLDLNVMISRAIAMGDEFHQRNIAASLVFLKEVAPVIAGLPVSEEDRQKCIRFLADTDQFFLNLMMATGKAVMDYAASVQCGTVVTVMSRNGKDFGIRISGMGDTWFTGPVNTPKGLYFTGFTEEDANPDMGDSAITETFGVGGMAMIAAPAVTRFVGSGGFYDALETSNRMSEITLSHNGMFAIPTWDFQGTCLGIDIRKVAALGILPVINTGIAHKVAGIGQIGAGTVNPPMECFKKAVLAYAEKLGFSYGEDRK